jgi:hypothetical protein
MALKSGLKTLMTTTKSRQGYKASNLIIKVLKIVFLPK